jgi:hypothetical protein
MTSFDFVATRKAREGLSLMARLEIGNGGEGRNHGASCRREPRSMPETSMT